MAEPAAQAGPGARPRGWRRSRWRCSTTRACTRSLTLHLLRRPPRSRRGSGQAARAERSWSRDAPRRSARAPVVHRVDDAHVRLEAPCVRRDLDAVVEHTHLGGGGPDLDALAHQAVRHAVAHGVEIDERIVGDAALHDAYVVRLDLGGARSALRSSRSNPASGASCVVPWMRSSASASHCSRCSSSAAKLANRRHRAGGAPHSLRRPAGRLRADRGPARRGPPPPADRRSLDHRSRAPGGLSGGTTTATTTTATTTTTTTRLPRAASASSAPLAARGRVRHRCTTGPRPSVLHRCRARS